MWGVPMAALLAFMDLPPDSPFTMAVKWMLGLIIATTILLVVNVALDIWILSVKRETRNLLRVIKEWTELGRQAREDAVLRGARVEAKTEETARSIKKDIQQVPDKVVEKIEGRIEEKLTEEKMIPPHT